jgi:hypothetical protein
VAFESVPQPLPEHVDVVSGNVHLTPAFLVSPATKAVNVSGWVEPTSTELPVAGGTISMVMVVELPPPQPQKITIPAHARK